jgi:DNA-binding NarL/FixJ family response regulator
MKQKKHAAAALASKRAAGRVGQRDAARLRSLTPGESKAVALVARGLTNKDAAAALGLAEQTVKNSLLHAFRKLGVRRRVELICCFGRYFRTRYFRTD